MKKLVATLDKCKVSDRDAVRNITATVQALHHNLEDLIINRTSIRRCRKRLRVEHAAKLRTEFKVCELDAVTIHWDGKMLPILMGKEQPERLPVILSCRGMEQLLGVSAISSGTGEDQASAVYELLNERELWDKVQAICSDTTASNTGRFIGACVLLEQKLGRDLLYLPCRHYIYEIILRSAFDVKMSKSLGPNVLLFKKSR